MKLLLAVAACVALSLSACTTPSPWTPATSPAVASTIKDDQAMYVLEVAYSGALQSVQAAVKSGQLKGANATKASAILSNVEIAMNTARVTYSLGQRLQYQSVLAIIAQLQPLVQP